MEQNMEAFSVKTSGERCLHWDSRVSRAKLINVESYTAANKAGNTGDKPCNRFDNVTVAAPVSTTVQSPTLQVKWGEGGELLEVLTILLPVALSFMEVKVVRKRSQNNAFKRVPQSSGRKDTFS